MATSVYSLGVAAGIGALFRSVQRGELPEVTRLIYEARENCLELVRKEAEHIGAERVMSTRLDIREIGQGLVEIVAIGTAVRRAPPEMAPHSEQLIPQALILDRASQGRGEDIRTLGAAVAPMAMARGQVANAAQGRLLGIIIALFIFMFMCCAGIIPALLQGQ
jgi:uncharacterized protein YbjQ (UPF0145 family)